MILLSAITLIWGCRRTPDHVLDKGDMAEVLADMHVAESVEELNRNEYTTDSTRKMLKQSVLAKHGVSTADFDSSLMWYGHNLDKYIEVYDQVIEILEKRNSQIGTEIVRTAVTMAGDSVDVWSGARYARISDMMPSRLVTFDLKPDENWEQGDVYTWRVKLIDDVPQTVHWTIVARYSDNTVDWYSYSSSNRGWNEAVFASDSTRTLSGVRGYFEVAPDNRNQYGKSKVSNTVWLDSISLIRKRVNADAYTQRHRVRHYKEF